MNLAYSCKRVAELLSQRLDEPLSLIDELRLRLHLSMCSNCSNVAEQLAAVSAASTELFSSDLDEEAKGPGSASPSAKAENLSG